jgi:hypothetical protein
LIAWLPSNNKIVDSLLVGNYYVGMCANHLKLGGGNWVVGERFWDREAELALLIERLADGANLSIVAPRRIGKTSLMREAARRLEDQFLCLHVDLQKAHSAADTIVELSVAAHPCTPLWEKTKSVFHNVLSGAVESIKIDELSITLRSGLTADNWQAKGDRLFEILAEHEKPVVLFLDELPILVNRLLKGYDYVITPDRRKDADALLSWVRSNSIRHNGKVRMVLAGSIGLEPLLRQAKLSSTLTTFSPFHLGPWSRDTAAGCLQALAKGYDLVLPSDATDGMLDRLTIFIPHHVEMFFEHVYEACRLRTLHEVSLGLVEEVYEHSMLGIRGHAELSHMEERLRSVLGPQLDLLAMDLLTEAAVAGPLTAAAAARLASDHCSEDSRGSLRNVLAVLAHDGYLIERGGGYVFESGLLRDWWKARFQFGYVPVAQRET